MINRYRVVLVPVTDDPMWSEPRVFRPEDFGTEPYQNRLPGSPVMAAVFRAMAEEPDQLFRLAVVADNAPRVSVANGTMSGDWVTIAFSPMLGSLISLPSEGRCPEGVLFCPERRRYIRPEDVPNLMAVRAREDYAGDIPCTEATGTLVGEPVRWAPPGAAKRWSYGWLG